MIAALMSGARHVSRTSRVTYELGDTLRAELTP